MKRSEINQIIRDAEAFIADHQFHLPPFAFWSAEDWAAKGDEAREIIETGLGWDITDFGMGDYEKYGLFLFTIRNGYIANLKKGVGKLYAEKLLICDVNQITPMHFHWQKTEDIINRGGGTLCIKVYNATPDGASLADSDVTVKTDGLSRTVAAGDVVRLAPGESITLEPYCYHSFWAEGERVLAGEVSTVNNDSSDNRWHEAPGRFPQIEEDEPPLYLLVTDYA